MGGICFDEGRAKQNHGIRGRATMAPTMGNPAYAPIKKLNRNKTYVRVNFVIQLIHTFLTIHLNTTA